METISQISFAHVLMVSTEEVANRELGIREATRQSRSLAVPSVPRTIRHHPVRTISFWNHPLRAYKHITGPRGGLCVIVPSQRGIVLRGTIEIVKVTQHNSI